MEYIDVRGRNLFGHWFAGLDDRVKVRIQFILERLELGHIPAKSVGAGVMELRSNFGPGFRVYLGRDGDALVILLAGGTKKRQSADIKFAQSLWLEYKQRKHENDAPY